MEEEALLMLRAIAYVSEARSELSLDQVEDLVRDAAAFNLNVGVTGVLLYDGKRFMQYLEGPEDALSVVYSRILGASSHIEIMELARARVSRRHFPFWSMRMLPSEPVEIRKVSLGDWSALVRREGRDGAPWAGLDHLSAVVAPHIA